MYRGRAREKALTRALRLHCLIHKCRLVMKGQFIDYDEDSNRDMDVAVCLKCIGDAKVSMHKAIERWNSVNS